MLLFITYFPKTGDWSQSFNTSHVVIYLLNEDVDTLKNDSFNTSHVVIYLLSSAL